ncbi:MAG: hypothetical protein HKN29_01760 [Rhodothermales bacterium]|nr:hypothetical protein [Rhodothermales bacterium]
MIVVKYFFEEPAALELLAPDDIPNARSPGTSTSLEAFLKGPRYHRGYLTASDLEAGTTGATTSGGGPDWIQPLIEAIGSDRAFRGPGTPRETALSQVLADPSKGVVLLVGPSAPPDQIPDLSGEVRDHAGTIRDLLDAGFVVLRPEPAHEGQDWSIFSPRPLSESVAAAFKSAQPGPARFVIPHRQARGEHKFYFERYDLSLFGDYRVT